MIVAIIKDSEKKARDAETAARRQELAVRREQERKQREQKREQERTDKRAEHKRKEREKAFESLISLPSEQQETRLGELAKRLNEAAHRASLRRIVENSASSPPSREMRIRRCRNSARGGDYFGVSTR